MAQPEPIPSLKELKKQGERLMQEAEELRKRRVALTAERFKAFERRSRMSESPADFTASTNP
jgi:hypothetical protein